MFFYLEQILKTFLIKLISFYQKSISPDHSWLRMFFTNGYCRFYPSCSEYSKQAINRHGPFKGGLMAAWRILRCNPWNKGGYDPVKKKN